MSFTFSNVKKIKHDDKFIVFGYIKQLQKKLSLQNIPQLITYLCLAFYHLGIDSFEKCHGLNIKISHNNQNISKSKFGHSHYLYDMAFCKRWIKTNKQQIMKWKLRMDKIGPSANSGHHNWSFRQVRYIIIRFMRTEKE